jgi:hypothetical protein
MMMKAIGHRHGRRECLGNISRGGTPDLIPTSVQSRRNPCQWERLLRVVQRVVRGARVRCEKAMLVISCRRIPRRTSSQSLIHGRVVSTGRRGRDPKGPDKSARIFAAFLAPYTAQETRSLRSPELPCPFRWAREKEKEVRAAAAFRAN